MSNPFPAPFWLDGGPVGALLFHGFTGSPPEMKPVGEYLNGHGLTVSGPLLPGHGTTMEDLDRRSWSEWIVAAENALDVLSRRCRIVFAGGLSLGSLVALELARRRPEVAGLMAYAPPFDLGDWRAPLAPLLKYFLRRVPHRESYYADPETENRLWYYEAYPSFAVHELLKLIDHLKKRLPEIVTPLLMVYATGDPRAKPDGADYLYRRIGSSHKEKLVLEESGHIVCADAQWEAVAERTLAFIRRLSDSG